MEELERLINKSATNKFVYLVVIEKHRKGYVLSVINGLFEANRIAQYVLSIQQLHQEDEDYNLENQYYPIKTYEVKGNMAFISSACSHKTAGSTNVYVVKVSVEMGGVEHFVRERENGSDLYSIEELLRRYERLMNNYSDFVFCAN